MRFKTSQRTSSGLDPSRPARSILCHKAPGVTQNTQIAAPGEQGPLHDGTRCSRPARPGRLRHAGCPPAHYSSRTLAPAWGSREETEATKAGFRVSHARRPLHRPLGKEGNAPFHCHILYRGGCHPRMGPAARERTQLLAKALTLRVTQPDGPSASHVLTVLFESCASPVSPPPGMPGRKTPKQGPSSALGASR